MRLEAGAEMQEALETRLDAIKVRQGQITIARLRKNHLQEEISKMKTSKSVYFEV